MGEIIDLDKELFVALDNGQPPPAADVVRSYGDKVGYRVTVENGIYKTGGPPLEFILGDCVIKLEPDPALT